MRDVWIRTTGRYKLLAQKERPAGPTTKWKKLRVPESAVEYVIKAFTGGDLLKWWKMYGDGRDISITELTTRYPMEF